VSPQCPICPSWSGKQPGKSDTGRLGSYEKRNQWMGFFCTFLLVMLEMGIAQNRRQERNCNHLDKVEFCFTIA
jgi:hypothetical protein